jgi:hypothetical protein
MTGSDIPPADDPARLPWLSRQLMWVDDKRNVDRLVWALALVCGALALADFLYHKHSYFPVENIPGFYGFYGFLMCAALVIAAKGLRVFLKRGEDYYAPLTVESEEHPDADLGRESVDA